LKTKFQKRKEIPKGEKRSCKRLNKNSIQWKKNSKRCKQIPKGENNSISWKFIKIKRRHKFEKE